MARVRPNRSQILYIIARVRSDRLVVAGQTRREQSKFLWLLEEEKKVKPLRTKQLLKQKRVQPLRNYVQKI